MIVIFFYFVITPTDVPSPPPIVTYTPIILISTTSHSTSPHLKTLKFLLSSNTYNSAFFYQFELQNINKLAEQRARDSDQTRATN